MIDLHNDCLTAKITKNRLESYLFACQKHLSKLYCPVFTTELNNPVEFINDKQKLLQKFSYTQICIEDIGFLPSNDFDFLLSIKPKYVGIVWNNSNMYGCGAYSQGGLTQKGKTLVKFLEKNNIIVDTAHMNYRTFFDFVNITQKPIFCSHTGLYSVVNDKRNFTDEQIKIIVQSGGIFGLFFVGKYLTKSSTFLGDDVVKNIDYFVQKFGAKNLAIGTDFYGTKDLPRDIQNYSQIEKIKQKMGKIGYKNTQIDDIFDFNAQKLDNW